MNNLFAIMELTMLKTKLNNKTDIKIFILYLLSNVGYPLSYGQINDITVQDDFVGSFEFAECFSELLETGNVKECEEDSEKTYLITEQGKSVAAALQSDILGFIRTKSLKSALRYLSFQKRGSYVHTEVVQRPDGKFDLKCQVAEPDNPTLEIQVAIDNRYQLNRMRHHFEENPETVYRSILALLSGEADYLL